MSDAGVPLDEFCEMLKLIPGTWKAGPGQAGIPPKVDILDLFDKQGRWRGTYDWRAGRVVFYSVSAARLAQAQVELEPQP